MDLSLFDKLDGVGGTCELNLQYRMNRQIMALSNVLVYDGLLQCGCDAVASGQLQMDTDHISEIWLNQVFKDTPYKATIFIDTSGVQAGESKDNSGMVVNFGESKIVQKLVSTCLKVWLEHQKQRAETQGQTVRQMLNKTKRLESTCPLDDQTSTDLMTIDHDREPEFNQQDDSDTNNTDLEANTPVEANKTAGANITIRAEIHHKSNDTDHHDHIIYEATPIQDLDAAKPTDEISTVPTDRNINCSN
ncbi:DNA2 [Mytilus edulis]|uniref:DNA2 n=1 Tax=Mytilus edulis TaxID=6550 RepID=A0A8S3T8X5_MYTED|nr:DNA2 [Mytilus edulis]